MRRPTSPRACGMRCSWTEILATGASALLVVACAGCDATPPEVPEASGDADSAGPVSANNTTNSGANTTTQGGPGSSAGTGGGTSGSAGGSTGSTSGSMGSTSRVAGSMGGATSSTSTTSGASGGIPTISTEACGRVTVDTSAVDHAAPGRIVVLGSSTAEGQRASTPDNAWVARYQSYLAETFPNFAIENLALRGLNTYQMQADDYVPPEGRPGPIRGNNITAALARVPDAIIINMPSNDQDEGFSLDEQMANYDRVAQLARDDGASVWIATAQPRNFPEAENRQGLMDTRDEIQARFMPQSIDFWTDLANPDGTMQSIYNSGDGTHFNDAGHAVLAQLVISCAIPEVILTSAK